MTVWAVVAEFPSLIIKGGLQCVMDTPRELLLAPLGVDLLSIFGGGMKMSSAGVGCEVGVLRVRKGPTEMPLLSMGNVKETAVERLVLRGADPVSQAPSPPCHIRCCQGGSRRVGGLMLGWHARGDLLVGCISVLRMDPKDDMGVHRPPILQLISDDVIGHPTEDAFGTAYSKEVIGIVEGESESKRVGRGFKSKTQGSGFRA